ncbi:hypothetical protein A3D77_02790 [Candidatus Gottesmanbacteria bacterium RIFCSPHIGHO2_02_FULL_39_11]|uniref:Uncharacterized protein n=1 Tax=Candidatus Gottesmanbacteria bacterium RIFCSPHIGHO2_02_FULL_39_11 TaxID=1798382 RepID=A0A1F5ZT31_9BACT|nr:MAG: hypothetical protein A3D77_02790 [Candidatus Gottesmanbacteria bacterium RIFCSPHIGHO2_02_FULL_39_11]
MIKIFKKINAVIASLFLFVFYHLIVGIMYIFYNIFIKKKNKSETTYWENFKLDHSLEHFKSAY